MVRRTPRLYAGNGRPSHPFAHCYADRQASPVSAADSASGPAQWVTPARGRTLIDAAAPGADRESFRRLSGIRI